MNAVWTFKFYLLLEKKVSNLSIEIIDAWFSFCSNYRLVSLQVESS